jgi:hypothetical protein
MLKKKIPSSFLCAGLAVPKGTQLLSLKKGSSSLLCAGLAVPKGIQKPSKNVFSSSLPPLCRAGGAEGV